MAPALAYTCRASTCLQAEVFSDFFFCFSCHPLQHPAAVELIWGENMAWCHLWHGRGDRKTSFRATRRNGRQTLVRRRLATICPLQWKLLLVSGSRCQSWITVCRLNINTMQIGSLRLGKASPGAAMWTGALTSPSLAGPRCSTSAAGTLNEPRASSGPGFLCSPPVSSSGWALCLSRKKKSWHLSVSTVINQFCLN